MKNIVVMGSTGSIGIQSLDVISKYNFHKVIGLTCHSNADLLFEQTKKYSPDFVAIDVIDSSHNLFNLGCDFFCFSMSLIKKFISQSRNSSVIPRV